MVNGIWKASVAARCLAAFFALLCSSLAWAYDAAVDKQLTGSVISSSNANSAPKAFDGDPKTYFSASSSTLQWVGMDLGTPHVITRVSYTPRLSSNGSFSSQYADYLVLSMFEGANSPDFMDAMPLHLIADAPYSATPTSVDVNVSRGFRYVRYVGGANSYCNIGDLRFFGHEGEGDDSQFYQITNLPTLSIHINNNSLPQNRGEDFESQSVLVYDKGTKLQEYPILIRVRGNYSATHENKAFRIKYNDGKSHHPMKDSGNEAPVKAKKWVLINSYRDKTVMRNPIGWEMSKRMGPKWTPWYQVVDLVLNGTYWGTYTLADHVDVHSGRIDITEMTPEDTEGEALTGGYYIEVDNNYSREPYHFLTPQGNTMSVHEPDEEVMQSVQFNYIRNTFNAMEAKVFSSNFTDETEGYRPHLDLESFLRYFLISEFNGNTDMICQVHMYKERGDDHFYTGPVWDHDLALENDQTVYPGNERMEWTYKVRQTGQWGSFVSRILSDPAAMARLQEIWAEIRQDSAVTASIMADAVDSLRREVRSSASLNFKRWPYLNQQLSLNPIVYGDWEKEVDAVRRYVSGRVAWMDKKLRFGDLEQVNGAYAIYTATDLITYIHKVKNGEPSANAILMADIDMSKQNERFEVLGTTAVPYCGQFDGRGHTISNLHVSGEDYVSFFGYVGAGCKVKNLFFDETCSFEGRDYVSAFVGYARTGALEFSACGNNASVKASGVYAAGFVAYSTRLNSTTIKSCYNAGDITANNFAAGLVGWTLGRMTISNSYSCGQLSGVEEGKQFAYSELDAKITNCYDLGSGQVTTITPRQIASGELCFNLNYYGSYQLWHQNIDNGRARDLHPVPLSTSGIVYKTDDGRYTNINSQAKAYRYFKLVVNTLQGGSGVIQLSEFDLLDETLDEVRDMRIYAGSVNGFGGEGWNNLADNNINTKFCGPFSSGMYFMFDAQKAIDIYGYRMYTANDTQSNPGRNPTGWALYGSNDYTTEAGADCWELIDEQKGSSELGATNFTPYDFMIPHSLKSIELKQHQAIIELGKTIQLDAIVTPSAMTDMAKLQWASSNERIVSVDEKGQITAHGTGEVDIIVTAPNYGLYADTCHVLAVDQAVGYRYYLMAINAIRDGGTIQFSEFDLLDSDGKEVDALKLYSYTGTSVSTHPHADMVDNTTSTKFCGGFEPPLYLYFDAGEQLLISAYRFYTANDTERYPGRNPISWQLYGSNTKSTKPNDADWVLIDERTNDNTIKGTNYTPYDFPLDYSEIIDGISASTDAFMGVGEIFDLEGRLVAPSSRDAKNGLERSPQLRPRIYIIGGRKILKK